MKNEVEASAGNLYLGLKKISNFLSGFLFSYLFFGDKKSFLKLSLPALSFLDYLILMIFLVSYGSRVGKGNFGSCFARWETRQRKGFPGETGGRRKLCSYKLIFYLLRKQYFVQHYTF